MSKSLELHVNYKKEMKELEELLKEDGSNSLSGKIENEDIINYLHKRRIRNRLNNLRTSYELLGIRRGEKIPVEWLKGLNKTEKRIFKDYFEKRKRYSEIGSSLGLEKEEVKKIIRYSIKRVMENIGRD